MAFLISAATWSCKATCSSRSIFIFSMVLLMIGPYPYDVKGDCPICAVRGVAAVADVPAHQATPQSRQQPIMGANRDACGYFHAASLR